MPDTEEEIKVLTKLTYVLFQAPLHMMLQLRYTRGCWLSGLQQAGKGNLCEGLIQGCSVSFKIWGSYHSHPSVSKKYPPPIYNYKG